MRRGPPSLTGKTVCRRTGLPITVRTGLRLLLSIQQGSDRRRARFSPVLARRGQVVETLQKKIVRQNSRRRLAAGPGLLRVRERLREGRPSYAAVDYRIRRHVREWWYKCYFLVRVGVLVSGRAGGIGQEVHPSSL